MNTQIRNDKVQTIGSVQKWGQFYLKEVDAILGQGNLQKIEQFSKELADFIDDLRKKWMGQQQLDRLKPDKQKLLRKLINELADLELEIASHIVVIRRDQELLIEMEQLAFPEVVHGGKSRNLSGWSQSPLYFPDSLLEKLATAEVPGGQ